MKWQKRGDLTMTKGQETQLELDTGGVTLPKGPKPRRREPMSKARRCVGRWSRLSIERNNVRKALAQVQRNKARARLQRDARC